MASIHEKKGRWYVVYLDPAKKRQIWSSLSKFAKRPVQSERVAKQVFADWLRQHKPLEHSGIHQFFSRYIAYSKPHKRPYTQQVDNRRIRAFLRWCVLTDRKDLGDIDKVGLEAFRTTLTCGPTTRRRYIETLRAAFNVAVEWKLLADNPAAGIKPEPNYNPRPTRALTDEEVETIFEHFPYPDREFCALGILAGLRRADIVWLAWEDIDFDSNLIRITPKPECGYTPKSTRYTGKIDVVPLHSRLRAVLTECPRRNAFVMPRYSEITWSHRIRRQFERWQIVGSIHSLRHTFITKLARSGVHPMALKSLARHSDLRTTLKYTHLTDADLRREIEKV